MWGIVISEWWFFFVVGISCFCFTFIHGLTNFFLVKPSEQAWGYHDRQTVIEEVRSVWEHGLCLLKAKLLPEMLKPQRLMGTLHYCAPEISASSLLVYFKIGVCFCAQVSKQPV